MDGRTGRAGRRRARGQSLVEFAFVVPLLLLVLLGTIDLGRAYADYVDLKAAARDGAGYGQFHPTDAAGIRARVLRHGVPAGTAVTASCTGNCTTIGGSGEVLVGATATFRPITTGFLSRFGLGSVALRAEARMRVMS